MELVGDDLLATNMERVRVAEEKGPAIVFC
jgi:hypothetical protein